MPDLPTNAVLDGETIGNAFGTISIMRRLLGVGIALAAGCSIDTGEEPPPPPTWGVPISGGTMTVTRDGNRAVVADPDRDRVYVVDLVAEGLADTIVLPPRSEPGRVIEDAAGRFHVALRGSGELLTITGGDRHQRPVCGEPRGLAYDEASDVVHVACATGELVSVPAGGGDPGRVVRVERDLRDVIVRDGNLAVTTFRSAQVLQLDAQGAVAERITPPITNRRDAATAATIPAIPSVAWRTIALPDGRLVIAHQRRVNTTLRVITGGYGGNPCSTAVESALTIVDADGTPQPIAPLPTATLPVDVAVSPTSGDIAIAAAGEDQVVILSASETTKPDSGPCVFANVTRLQGLQIGAPTAVAWRPSGGLVAFYPEAGGLTIHDGGTPRGITLVDLPQNDAGRTLFHRATSVGLACASCHPEGRDDGGVWMFETLGPRRTQSLGGGLLARAPFHWSGDMPTLHALVQNVFTQRMGGHSVGPEQERALAAWLDRIPAPRGVTVDAAAVARGEELFFASEQGCASCHNGPLYTNNTRADVGTKRFLKVPSLVGVGARAPFLHDGCATTLRDRFGPCGGGDLHGRTSHLSEAELADLIAYLESL